MKNITTPRTLADCSWVTGYSAASMQSRRSSWQSVALATVIGVALACAVVYGGF